MRRGIDGNRWNELSAAIADDKIVRAFYDFLLGRQGVKPHYFGKDIPVGKYQKDLKDANRSDIDKFVQSLIESEPLVETGWIQKTALHQPCCSGSTTAGYRISLVLTSFIRY